jgi:hypothetical protein
MVDYAAARDFGGLDSMIRHYQARCDAVDGKAPADKNGLFHSRVGNRWALKGDHDNLAGKTIDTAIRAATDKPGDNDDRTPAKRRSDALTRICRFFLDHGDAPIEAGEVPHISIVLTDKTVRHRTPTEPGETALSAAEIDQLLCEANLSRIVLGADGVPLDVGRATRYPSRALRRALDVRDKHCRFPGCDRRPSWCQGHHVVDWIHDGDTKLSNLVLLCSFHHHLIHKPGWHVTFDGHTFTATNPDGKTIGATVT